MKIIDSIYIDAPRNRVFGVFCDLDRAADIIEDISKIEILEGSSPLNVGTKWRETRKLFGKEATEEMWVTSYQQDVSYVVEANSRGTRYRSSYRFTPQEGGTRVDFSFEGTPQSVGAKITGAVGGLFLGAMKKSMHEDLVQLKVASEQAG